MGNYFEPVLTEEQLSAYLDGMLPPDESAMVENIISSDPELEDIMDVMDNVDSAYIYESDDEVPIECMSDDFTLPVIDMEYTQSAGVFDTDEYANGYAMQNDYDNSDSYDDEREEIDNADDSTEIDNDGNFLGDDYDGITF